MSTLTPSVTNPKHHNAVFSAEELLASPLPEPKAYAVHGILRLNMARPSLLVGLPRAGKSTLAIQMAVAVSNGDQFLERPTTMGHVIYWRTEDSPEHTKEQFMKAGLKQNVSVIFPNRLPSGTTTDDKKNLLLAELAKHPDTRLVIIETLASYAGKVALNESTDVIEVLDRFQSEVMQHHPKPAYLLLHQFNKEAKGNDRAPKRAMMRVNGSIFLSAGAAATIYLDQVSDEDKRRIVMTEGRDGDIEIDPTYLVFDQCTNTSTLGGLVADEKKAKAQEKAAKSVMSVEDVFEQTLKNNPGITKTKFYEEVRQAGLKIEQTALTDALDNIISLGWASLKKDGKNQRLVWNGKGAKPAESATTIELAPTDQEPVEKSATPPVTAEHKAGIIEAVPSFGTIYAVSSHICEALDLLTDDKRVAKWDTVIQNLLMAGNTPEHICEVFDYARKEKGTTEAMLKGYPHEAFGKKFSQLAKSMAEGTVTA
jgi:hypothetical protein